ncbi:hypothetical protein [Achromobacter deleyi]|uniref:hypothetical protein n=1 Tax=Achromobacter deleyi TaxID=1353891 RepID=UPI001581E550|nr:hypothetical protein [Achromobacter deleyi]
MKYESKSGRNQYGSVQVGQSSHQAASWREQLFQHASQGDFPAEINDLELPDCSDAA